MLCRRAAASRCASFTWGGMRLQNLVWTVALSALAAAWTAADNSGSILITVTGPDRSAITGAAVEVVSRSLIAARTTATDARGKVLLVGLLPGRYRLRVTRAGYEAAQRDVGLLQDRTVELVIPLRVEAVRETVMVSEPLPTVDTRSATVAAHITAEQVEAVPVGRDYRAYEQLVPGVNVVPNSDGIETRYEPASKSGNFFYDRGAAMGSRDNTYLLDGFNITDMAGGTGSLALDNDAILEEEVITSGLPAEYPGGSGSVANIVTRLGGPTTSGSLDYFLQRPSMYAGFATGDSRLRAAREDKHDGGLTIGGPLARDRAWFFAAGQERTNSDDVELSASASPMPRHETYGFRRTNGLGKLTVRPSGDSVLTAVAFADLRRTDGTRDVNTPPNRYADLKDDALTYGLSYQRLLAAGALAELQLFDSRRDASAVPADSGAGPTNTVLYEPGATVPAYLRDLGSSGDPSRTVQRKRQAEIAFTRFVHAFGDHQIKAGVQWQRWEEANSTQRIFGNSMTSLAPPLAGLTLGGARDLNLLPASEADVIYRTLVSAPTSAAFRALDTDHDGVLTPAEFAAAVFGSTAGNAAGVNFLRQQLQYAGVNNVGQTEWAFFLQDEWRLGRWSVAAGARVEKIRYFASDGSTILAMAPAVYPRLGIAWDLKGDGRQKLSFAYGRYSDPLLSPMIRFAGNLSGSIWADEVFLGDSWFSYRTRGSATVARDAGFAPDLKNQVATELQLVYGVNLTPAVGFLAQIYNRREDNLIEDYDPAVYFSPAAGRLALAPADFGYPASGPGAVNYFLGNLVGGKRRAWGVDLSLERRFAGAWGASLQYSWKRAEGNSTSNGDANLQGDFLGLDPRQPYMYGPLPGTIEHQVKVFGSYRTRWGVEVGALVYWNGGAVFTESDIFRPGSYDIYYNHRLPDGSYVRAGTERQPAYTTVDLRFGYTIPVRRAGSFRLVLDVMNALDNQGPIRIEEGHNSPDFAYRAPRLLLEPRRYQLGVKYSW